MVLFALPLLLLAVNFKFPISLNTSYVSLSFTGVFITLVLLEAFARLSWICILYPKFFSPLRHLPQPSGGSFLMGQFPRLFMENPGEPFREWVDTIPHNGIIRYLDIFNLERIAVVSPAALADVLVHRNYDFEKPPKLRENVSRILGNGILFAEGDAHKAQRKNLMPAFAFRHIKNLYPIFWSKSREMVQAAAAASKSPSNGDTAVNISDWASRSTLDIIGTAGMGKDFKAIQDPENILTQSFRNIFSLGRMKVAISLLLGILGLALPSWIVQKIPNQVRNPADMLLGTYRTPNNRDIDNTSNVIKSTCRSLVESKREKAKTGSDQSVDIISVALDSGAFSDEDLVNQMMTFLVAGHETTAAGLAWAVYMICKHPEVQEKLREELCNSNLPDPFDTTATVTSSDIDNLPYLSAVCNETLRLYAPVAATVRIAARDTMILDEPIPKGTDLVLPIWSVNAARDLWGDDARSFKPDRWLAPGAANTGGASSNFSFLTFLHGPRSCMGQAFAKGELACLVAAWFMAFETTLVDENAKLKVQHGITTRPSGGIWVKIKTVAP